MCKPACMLGRCALRKSFDALGYSINHTEEGQHFSLNAPFFITNFHDVPSRSKGQLEGECQNSATISARNMERH